MSKLTCPSGSYITVFEGKSGDSVDKFCAVCSDGSRHCNGVGEGGGWFSTANKKGFSNISNYGYGNDDMTGFGINNNGTDFKRGTTFGGVNKKDFTCPNGTIMNEISYVGDTTRGWAHQVSSINCIPLPSSVNSLDCPSGAYITELSGGAGGAIDRLCAKCSDGTNLGCLGVSGGGSAFNSQQVSNGFNKIDMGFIDDSGDTILNHMKVYSNDSDIIPYVGGKYMEKPASIVCNSGQVINSIKPIKATNILPYVPSISGTCIDKPAASSGSGAGSNTGDAADSNTSYSGTYILLFIIFIIVIALLFMSDGSDEPKNRRRMMNMQPMYRQPMYSPPMASPYPQNNMNMQPMNMQPMNNQPMNNQPMNNQPMNNQPMASPYIQNNMNMQRMPSTYL
jgi:hypothetical protein